LSHYQVPPQSTRMSYCSVIASDHSTVPSSVQLSCLFYRFIFQATHIQLFWTKFLPWIFT